MSLSTPLTDLKGVGDKTAVLFQRLGITTVEDLVWHLPRRYDDYSVITNIDRLEPGAVTIRGKVTSVSGRYVRRGLHITQAEVRDDTGAVTVTWFNQPYRAKALKEDKEYFLSGEFAYKNNRYSLSNPATEQVSNFQKNAARIVPIYKETKGLTSHLIRRAIASAWQLIESVPEELPESILKECDLMSLNDALHNVHFPDTDRTLQASRRRLAFDELFGIILASELSRIDNQATNAPPLNQKIETVKKFVDGLEFSLTDAQRRSAWEAIKDLEQTHPMNRLLEGDVGSGKTVVAAMALLVAHANAKQSMIMAPTEILAKQHLSSLKQLLEPFGARIGLLSGSLTPSNKKAIKTAVAAGEITVLIGTHALIEENVKFKNLSLVIIDEQHRFGVSQRRKLQQKSGEIMPHMLSMTATPIPRSLALTVYGELDLSIIDEMPPGRKQTKTKLISPNSRKQMYDQITEQLEKGHQAFFVYPLIDPSDKLAAQAATEAYDKLRNGVFKSYRVGLLHGRLSAAEKDDLMQKFVDHELDLLISTTVIEVGVNVPNATVMVIESAERFGLAQLHQLRGRVGRAQAQAYCYVVPSTSQSARQRLQQFVQTANGFELAEIDLEQRGPGEIYGATQHGALDLRIAKLSDQQLIRLARKYAKKLAGEDPELANYPVLKSRVLALRSMTRLN